EVLTFRSPWELARSMEPPLVWAVSVPEYPLILMLPPEVRASVWPRMSSMRTLPPLVSSFCPPLTPLISIEPPEVLRLHDTSRGVYTTKEIDAWLLPNHPDMEFSRSALA